MPLAGSLDIRDLLVDAPTVTLDDRELHVDDVDILQIYYEIAASDVEGLLPPALNPTIPPVVSFLAYRAADSELGPFSLVQARIAARAGVRPRAFLVSARCDNPAAAEVLSGSWGFRIQPAEIGLRRYHDRVECDVVADRQAILRIALVDPEPITGHDIQYAPGMHLARSTTATRRSRGSCRSTRSTSSGGPTAGVPSSGRSTPRPGATSASFPWNRCRPASPRAT